MSNFCSMAKTISRMGGFYKEALKGDELENLGNLVQGVVTGEQPGMRDVVVTSWAENNGIYLDFRLSLKPDWVITGHEVKMTLSVATDSEEWYVSMVVDSADGEMESWGCKCFSREQIATMAYPVGTMLDEIRKQYMKMLEKEQAKEIPGEIMAGVNAAAVEISIHVDEIKKICQGKGVKMWIDRNINGMPTALVLPDTATISEYRDDFVRVYDEEKLPEIGFGFGTYDSGIDYFGELK